MLPVPRETGTREKLLEAGAQAISAKSFNACGLAEILAAAGVPKGSFYHYFASKEDFGVALIDRACGEFVEFLEPMLGDQTRTPLERLRAVFEQSRQDYAAFGAGRQCLIPKLALETSQLSEPVHAAVKRAYEKWSARLAEVIREAQAVGEIDRGHDPERLANVLVMLWEGATIRMQIDRTLQPVDDFLTFVFDSLLKKRS
ncbi:MAG: TetR family transcriptional regulator C-terminal domain-containing protein [Planctomycetes bacterium]|jgi:TetR/AcrR family transcriptional repressor of nem operon|nr:TetR family transcriptional regulator C-terminal domain-containing protein [Planctomycetota bacterium]